MQRRQIFLAGAAIVVVAGTLIALIASHRQAPPAPIASPTTRLVTATPKPSPTPSASSCANPAGSPPSATLGVPFATALAFAPNGTLFIAERSGTVAVANGNTITPFAHVDTVNTEPGGGYSERGLLGLAISPTFAKDGFVYALYDLTDYAHENIVRWTDCAGRATNFTTLASFPAGSDCCHKGGRLAFGPDGMLYVTIGEEHVAAAAQDTGDPRGKVLRLNPDGSAAAGNPFGNMVWAYGLRNPFGIAFGSDGTLLVTSNGPSGDAHSPSTGYDLALLVSRGAHFQWPYCYGYSHQNVGWPPCAGMAGPVWSSEQSTVVPTGATWVDGSGPAGYANHFVFCTYDAGGLILSLGNPGAVTAGPAHCNLDIVQGPGHALYYSDLGHIYRLG